MGKRKNKKPGTVVQKMTMKPGDVADRRRLVKQWEVCVVCGHDFANLACVTKEHVIPRSVMVPHTVGNIAASHYTCNMLRRANSIIATARMVEHRRRTMNHRHFLLWLNRPVPNRIVPHEALQPLRVPACFELPEHLPGM